MTGKWPGERLFRTWGKAEPPPFDEEAGRARFLERFAAGRARGGRRYFVMAAAAVMGCGVALGGWHTLRTVSFTTAMGEGQAGAWLATNSASDLPLTFSEGTELVMAPGSRGRVEGLERTGASFLLERGEVRARVVHRPGTNWRFLAGPFEVHVTGTSLGVDWDPARERLAVRVDEGSVVVSGPNVGEPRSSAMPSASTVVRAGQVCVVDLPSRTTRISPIGQDVPVEAEAPVDAGVDGLAAPVVPVMAPPSTPRPPAPAAVSWLKLSEKGDYDGAYAAALSAGLASVLRASSSDELLRLAQVARLSGHRDTERQALVTCRRRFPGTERAAVAAYELGRSSSPSEASSWFDTYLGEQPNGALAREAAGRLVESRAAAGDDRGAREAAARYLGRYPNGPHAPLARRVLAGAHE
jgi:transmembrane sensor